jgi:hypothetical protein
MSPFPAVVSAGPRRPHKNGHAPRGTEAFDRSRWSRYIAAAAVVHHHGAENAEQNKQGPPCSLCLCGECRRVLAGESSDEFQYGAVRTDAGR